jgi:hypothetical protein
MRVDYAGPIHLRVGIYHSKVTCKGFVTTFVCLAIKAIHLEAVTSLTIEAFLAAVKRFTTQTGLPQQIYSDNDTNFQGPDSQLLDFGKLLQSKEQSEGIQVCPSNNLCEWKFIPPYAAHFGGLWEAAVKSMKYYLCRTLSDQIVT